MLYCRLISAPLFYLTIQRYYRFILLILRRQLHAHLCHARGQYKYVVFKACFLKSLTSVNLQNHEGSDYGMILHCRVGWSEQAEIAIKIKCLNIILNFLFYVFEARGFFEARGCLAAILWFGKDESISCR